MPPIESGTYTPNLDVELRSWPSPDANGDGVEVTDENGDTKTDSEGRPIKRYKPPTGFVNKAPQNEHGVTTGENWVLVDESNNVVRDSNGDAVTIAEGTAIVLHQDGTTERLTTPQDKRRFSKGYSKQGGASTVPGASKTDLAPAPSQAPDVSVQQTDGTPVTPVSTGA